VCSEMRYSLPEESAWALMATIEELSDNMSAEVLATALLRVSPVRQPLKARRGAGEEVGERLP
jgi:hypothetical protein